MTELFLSLLFLICCSIEVFNVKMFIYCSHETHRCRRRAKEENHHFWGIERFCSLASATCSRHLFEQKNNSTEKEAKTFPHMHNNVPHHLIIRQPPKINARWQISNQHIFVSPITKEENETKRNNTTASRASLNSFDSTHYKTHLLLNQFHSATFNFEEGEEKLTRYPLLPAPTNT